ncbi:MAG: hypothetical protein ACNA7I_04150 [Candidatus Methanoperedens sp.]
MPEEENSCSRKAMDSPNPSQNAKIQAHICLDSKIGRIVPKKLYSCARIRKDGWKDDVMNGDQNHIKEEENARVGYQVAVDLLIAEEEGIWSRFNVMLVANSIIIAIIGLAPTNQPTPPIFDSYLPFVGLVLCIWWFVLINRGYS